MASDKNTGARGGGHEDVLKEARKGDTTSCEERPEEEAKEISSLNKEEL